MHSAPSPVQIHPRLESELSDALADIPPLLTSARTARAEVVAMTVEISLLKLSLIRTHAFRSLYGHNSPMSANITMNHALGAVATKLREQQAAQREEQVMLDSQIDQYSRMLQLVDGHDGGFAQVVEDMSRVQKETEECRKDLRRLGWTGD